MNEQKTLPRYVSCSNKGNRILFRVCIRRNQQEINAYCDTLDEAISKKQEILDSFKKQGQDFFPSNAIDAILSRRIRMKKSISSLPDPNLFFDNLILIISSYPNIFGHNALQIFTLYYQEYYSTSQIADILNLSRQWINQCLTKTVCLLATDQFFSKFPKEVESAQKELIPPYPNILIKAGIGSDWIDLKRYILKYKKLFPDLSIEHIILNIKNVGPSNSIKIMKGFKNYVHLHNN